MATLNFRLYDKQGNLIDGPHSFTVSGSAGKGVDYDGRLLWVVTNTHLAFCDYEPGVGVNPIQEFNILSGLNSNMQELTSITTHGNVHWVTASQNIFRSMSATRVSDVYMVSRFGDKILELPNYQVGALATPGHNDITTDGTYLYATHQSTSVIQIGGGSNTTYYIRKFYPDNGRSIFQNSGVNNAGITRLAYSGAEDYFYATRPNNDFVILSRNLTEINSFGGITGSDGICIIGNRGIMMDSAQEMGFHQKSWHSEHIGTLT